MPYSRSALEALRNALYKFKIYLLTAVSCRTQTCQRTSVSSLFGSETEVELWADISDDCGIISDLSRRDDVYSPSSPRQQQRLDDAVTTAAIEDQQPPAAATPVPRVAPSPPPPVPCPRPQLTCSDIWAAVQQSRPSELDHVLDRLMACYSTTYNREELAEIILASGHACRPSGPRQRSARPGCRRQPRWPQH